jgi:hypothetical protein
MMPIHETMLTLFGERRDQLSATIGTRSSGSHGIGAPGMDHPNFRELSGASRGGLKFCNCESILPLRYKPPDPKCIGIPKLSELHPGRVPYRDAPQAPGGCMAIRRSQLPSTNLSMPESPSPLCHAHRSGGNRVPHGGMSAFHDPTPTSA